MRNSGQILLPSFIAVGFLANRIAAAIRPWFWILMRRCNSALLNRAPKGQSAKAVEAQSSSSSSSRVIALCGIIFMLLVKRWWTPHDGMQSTVVAFMMAFGWFAKGVFGLIESKWDLIVLCHSGSKNDSMPLTTAQRHRQRRLFSKLGWALLSMAIAGGTWELVRSLR